MHSQGELGAPGPGGVPGLIVSVVLFLHIFCFDILCFVLSVFMSFYLLFLTLPLLYSEKHLGSTLLHRKLSSVAIACTILSSDIQSGTTYLMCIMRTSPWSITLVFFLVPLKWIQSQKLAGVWDNPGNQIQWVLIRNKSLPSILSGKLQQNKILVLLILVSSSMTVRWFWDVLRLASTQAGTKRKKNEIWLSFLVVRISLDTQCLNILCCLQGDMGPVGIMGLLGPPGLKVNVAVFSFFL